MSGKNNISKNSLRNSQKAVRRDAMLELGIYNIHKNRTFKSKKNYTRKPKHRDSY